MMETTSKQKLLERKENINVNGESARGLYFLIRNEEIVYVGKSNKNVFQRISNHTRNKEFDSFSYELHPNKSEDGLSELEAEYIAKFAPEYNKQLHSDRYFYLSDISDTGIIAKNQKVELECTVIKNKVHIDIKELKDKLDIEYWVDGNNE